MEPFTLIGAGIGVLASAISKAFADGDRRKAEELLKQAEAEYGPDDVAKLKDTVARTVGPTAFGGIQEDSQLRNSQLSALRALENEYATGGQSEGDLAALRLAQQAGNQVGASAAASAQQSARSRGVANSGLEAALYSQAGQDATDATANAGTQSQMAARQRALQALSQAGDVAGGIRSQDYAKARDTASATDRLNEYNASAQTNNDAANNDTAQQRYLNEQQRKQLLNNARGNRVKLYTDAAKGTEELGAGIGEAANSLGGGYGRYLRKKGG